MEFGIRCPNDATNPTSKFPGTAGNGQLNVDNSAATAKSLMGFFFALRDVTTASRFTNPPSCLEKHESV
jgi:hypothetical protein